MVEIKLTDTSVMWFGIHKGKTMANVPAGYLLFLYKTPEKLSKNLKFYIEDNMAILEQELKLEKLSNLSND